MPKLLFPIALLPSQWSRRRSTNNILLAPNPHDPRGFCAKLSDFGQFRWCGGGQLNHDTLALEGVADVSCRAAPARHKLVAQPLQRSLPTRFCRITAGLSTALAARQTHRTSQLKGTVDFMPPGALHRQCAPSLQPAGFACSAVCWRAARSVHHVERPPGRTHSPPLRQLP